MTQSTAASTVVLKFGGTSVGTPDRIRAVAQSVKRYREEFSRVVVVVSAMGQATDDLISLALDVSPHAKELANRREMDMLLSAGERISMALLSLALSDLSVKAVSFTGSQSGIITSPAHGEANIAEIRPIRIEESLNQGRVVIVAGFQGVSPQKEITTLGRGGSDTTAVALGAVLGAQKVVIFTDVSGFYSADPRKVKGARQYARLGWDTALNAAHFGSQVLHPRCVEAAWKQNLPIELKSSFSDVAGTWIEGVDVSSLEGPKVFSVASQTKLQVADLPLKDMKEAAAILSSLRDQGVKISGWKTLGQKIQIILDEDQDLGVLKKYTHQVRGNLARVTVVGVGLLTSPEPHAIFQKVLSQSNCTVIESEAQPTFLSALLENEKGLDAMVESLHSELI